MRILAALMLAATLNFTSCNNVEDDNSSFLLLLLGGGGSTGNTVINIAAMSGVTAPVLGAIPVTTISETAQYTGTVAWDGGWAWSTRFGGDKAYTATITLTAKPGYTLTGVSSNFFTVPGATGVTNSANSGVITAVFPATAAVAVGEAALGGKVAYILATGDPGYVAGEQRGLIAASGDQGVSIIWAIAAYQATAVGGTGIALGTGLSNTVKIITQNGTGSTYAAGLARACTDGGYTDWYLPSINELGKLYDNRDLIGGFAEDFYWSSSEYGASSSWFQTFRTGGQYDTGKGITSRVRAVRAF